MTTTSRTYAVFALAAAATLTVAACGGSATSGSTSTATAPASSAGASGSGNGGQGGFRARTPGVNGLIAAVQGSTLQVQTRTDQTAVTWTAATKVTAEVTVPSSTLKVGDCVLARPAVATGGAAGGANGTQPSGATVAPTTVAAATVQILASATGCTLSGVHPIPRANGGATNRPTGGATGNGTRTGRFGARGAGGFGTVGAVASLGAGRFTVTEAAFVRGGANGDASASTTPHTVTVTFTSATRFTTNRPSTAKAITVGECVAAKGKPDDTGTVAATALLLSPATNGQCTGGFGRA